MPNELAGFALMDAAKSRWSWQGDIRQQIINTDIDGLLTGALLCHNLGWPIIGFNDTKSQWIDASVPTPLALAETAWVDLDMCMPGARVLSQHVVSNSAEEAGRVQAFAESVNPNLLVGRHRLTRYRDKYPFGTFQWIAWLVGDIESILASHEDAIGAGLAWMPDGGFDSVLGPWRDNCLDWALNKMSGCLLTPLARTNPTGALRYVAQAEEYLRRESGVDTGWRNHQWRMSRHAGRGPEPLIDPNADHDQIQALLDTITTYYGWRRAVIPTSYNRFTARWQSANHPPPGWPGSANRSEVVSVAVTRAHEWCWTEN